MLVLLLLTLFVDDAAIKAIELVGGSVQTIPDLPSNVRLRQISDPQLRDLSLSVFAGGRLTLLETKLTDRGLQAIKGTGFRYLDISYGNKYITLEGVVEVTKQMPQLKELSLLGKKGDLSKLSDVKLTRLSLLGPLYTDEDIVSVAKLNTLTHLVLIGSKVSPEVLGELKRALPNTKITVED